MNRIILFTLLAINFTKTANAQQITYSNVIEANGDGVQVNSAVETTYMSCVMAGNTLFGRAFIIKTDSSGDIVWNKTFGSNASSASFGDITGTNDSGFALTGRIKFNTASISHLFCARVNNAGDTLWTATYSFPGYELTGAAIKQTMDSGFIITGSAYDSLATNCFLAKTDSDGNLMWMKIFSRQRFAISGSEVAVNNDSTFYLGGTMDSLAGNKSSFYLAQYSTSGFLLTSKEYTLSNQSYFTMNEIHLYQHQVLFNVNSRNSFSTFIDVDSTGNPIKYFSLVDYEFLVGKNKFISFADTSVIYSQDYYATISDSDWAGNNYWSASINLVTAGVLATADHGILAYGNGPVQGVRLRPGYNPQIGIVKMDSTGNGAMCTAPFNNILPVSSNLSTGLFTMNEISGGFAVSSVISVDTASIYLRSGCVDFLGNINSLDEKTLRIIPNPSHGLFTISSDELKDCVINIYNSFSDLIFCSQITENNSLIDLSGNAAGVYYFSIERNNSIISRGKLLVSY